MSQMLTYDVMRLHVKSNGTLLSPTLDVVSSTPDFRPYFNGDDGTITIRTLNPYSVPPIPIVEYYGFMTSGTPSIEVINFDEYSTVIQLHYIDINGNDIKRFDNIGSSINRIYISLMQISAVPITYEMMKINIEPNGYGIMPTITEYSMTTGISYIYSTTTSSLTINTINSDYNVPCIAYVTDITMSLKAPANMAINYYDNNTTVIVPDMYDVYGNYIPRFDQMDSGTSITVMIIKYV